MIGPWATAERSEKSRSWARRHIGEKGDDAVQSYYNGVRIYGLEFCLSRVLWEMTFFGVDESGVELEKEKLDTRFEEAQRFFDENKEPQIGFSIEDIAKKLLGDDYTEDWYPEEEQERDRRNMVISSYIASTTAALFWWVDG